MQHSLFTNRKEFAELTVIILYLREKTMLVLISINGRKYIKNVNWENEIGSN